MASKIGSKDKARRFRALIERDGDFCHYCGVVLSDESRSMDHIVPRSRGGTNVLENLVLACKPCNNKKGAKSYAHFVSWISGRNTPSTRDEISDAPVAELAYATVLNTGGSKEP